jgi:D-serine deaminase-like pyridoxal phosphate-dependent protein
MTSRRAFLSSSAAMGILAATQGRAATGPSPTTLPVNELEARIDRRDFTGMTKDMLPTPCMVVDIDMFQANVKHMAVTAKANGINVRPHVKIHKSVDVAKHQVAAGAIGLTCATIAEAELFSSSGIKGILWTKQPVSVNNIQRAITLSKQDPPSCSSSMTQR